MNDGITLLLLGKTPDSVLSNFAKAWKPYNLEIGLAALDKRVTQ